MDEKEIAYVWEYGRYKVTIFEYDKWLDYRRWHSYRLEVDGEIIFEDHEFSPSPVAGYEIGDAQVAELLSFLTLRSGDTDDEYFKDYTPRQLEWCQSDEAEELSMMASDYEEYGTWEYEDA